MSAGGKVTKMNKEKTAKVIPPSQTGKIEANQANIRNQITELTGLSKYEALTVLYDCDYDVDRAVKKILERQGDKADERREIGKKKKEKKVGPNKGSLAEIQTALKTEKLNAQEFEQLNHTDNLPHGRRDRRDHAPPRFNRGHGRGGYGGPDSAERSRENTSHEREQGFESTRGHRRAWTDVKDERKADEWRNGSSKESCVFTPSASRSAATYSVPNDTSDGKSVRQTVTITYESTNQQQTQLSGSAGDAGVTVQINFSSMPPPQTKAAVAGQDTLKQKYVAKEPEVGMMTSDCYGNNKEATKCIRNVTGIGRGSLSQNAPNADEMSAVPLLNDQQQSVQMQRARQPRPRLPPPSKVASLSPPSRGLLTSATKASGPASSQLGFNQLAYSASSVDGMASDGPKLPMANRPSHYGSYNYQGGSGSLVTMSSDYNLAQGQMQYAYSDAQHRFGVNSPQGQPGFGPMSLPPGYSSGPLPNQLHYSQQGPMKPFHVQDEQPGSYFIGSDRTVLYQWVTYKQGTTFPTALSQPYDASAWYQSGAGFQSGNQPNSASLAYPGVASGNWFHGLSMESGGFEAGHYQNQSVYRSREGQAGYYIGGADSEWSIPTSGAAFSGAQGLASQSFGSNFGVQARGVQSSGAYYGAGPSQAPQSAGASFNSHGQSVHSAGVTYGPQGQSAPPNGSYGNQRQGKPSAGASAFGKHGQGSQFYADQGQAAHSTTATIAQEARTIVIRPRRKRAGRNLFKNMKKLRKAQKAAARASILELQ